MDETTDPIETDAADLDREVIDRRAGMDRRQLASDYDGPDRRSGESSDRRTGLERRRGAGIRREEDRRSAEEGEMTVEQFEFVQAIEAFKKSSNTPFPNWINVLDVILSLGYRLADEPTLELAADAKIMNPDFAHLTGEPAQFVKAIEAYKAVNRKRFPTWTEVLEVVEQLGYRKVMARIVTLPNVPEAPIRAAA